MSVACSCLTIIKLFYLLIKNMKTSVSFEISVDFLML